MNRNQQTLLGPLPQACQTVAFSTSPKDSSALPQYTVAVDLMATQDCRVEFKGGSTEATADATGGSGGTGVTISLSAFIKAGLLYRYAVPTAGTGAIVSVVRSSADGNLEITPLSN